MVTCNRLAAKCEDRLRFTFELGFWASPAMGPRVATVVPHATERPDLLSRGSSMLGWIHKPADGGFFVAWSRTKEKT